MELKPQILCNPRLSIEERNCIFSMLANFSLPNHYWLGTSGSSGKAKWVALSEQALLASAQAVNTHLQSTSQDKWLQALPDFHVGGLGVRIRASLSGAAVIDSCMSVERKWDVERFHRLALENQITLTALVPTQLYDLVAQNLQAPASLRATIIGGAALDKVLYRQAATLGWKPLPSYGQTECASQVATASIKEQAEEFPRLHLLPHLQLRQDPSTQQLWVKGSSLLTGYVINGEFMDPKQEGWLNTGDRGKVLGMFVEIEGRAGRWVKIGGESVDLTTLDSILEECKQALNWVEKAVIVAVPEDRLGHVIHLATTAELHQKLVDCFNQRVMPFERIRCTHVLVALPRTSTHKIDAQKLIDLLRN